ncbi:hypothetical protein [Stenotrophomonas sp.]|uniref:hypothetical protein n=1 Tax=Stenotrophomonas sp. TaxID=69392 RepID=UPI002FC9E0C3
MNSEQFVQAIQQHAQDAATDTTMRNLQSPPGRRPAARAVALSQWYNGLSDQDKANVRAVVGEATHAAVFGVLAVLDGVRVVDEEKGRFELFHVGRARTLLNPGDRDLHDLLD